MTVAFPTRILEELQSYLLFFSQEFLKNIDETSSDKKLPHLSTFSVQKADDWKISPKDWKSSRQQLIIQNLPIM